MKVLLVRHGRAEDREAFAESGHGDDLRPLTAKGRRAMRRAAKGLVEVLPSIDVLATSPLIRAMETAAIVAREYGNLEPEELKDLSPGSDPQVVLRWLRRQDAEATIALVGHEPHMGRLASLLLAGKGEFVKFKKGGACLLDLPDPKPARAQLLWSLTPAHLRQLGKQ